MKPASVAVVRTGSANLASVLAAVQRVGAIPQVVDDADAVRAAQCVVLPGVGHYGSAMQRLTQRGLGDAIATHVASGAPFLAICLGMQLLATGSEESVGTAGLGIMPGSATRFGNEVRVPQLGWNQVHIDTSGSLVEDGWAYYANSYALRDAPAGWQAAWTTHGERFVAALSRGPQLACQFHPELSGRWGAALLERWWAAC